MKTSLFLGTALSFVLASSVASAAQTHFKATLNGAQEVPAFTTSATGMVADLVYDDTSNDLTGTITITGIADGDFVQAHIHSGACGVAGNILVNLPDQASHMLVLGAGDVVIDQAGDIQDLMDGKLYINVHTAANGGNGDIR